MVLSRKKLANEIQDYIAANPDEWNAVIDMARNSGPPDPESKAKAPEEYRSKDIGKWYERLRRLGKGHDVLVADDPKARQLGFQIIKNGKLTSSHSIGLVSFKEQREKLPAKVLELLRTPGGRSQLANLISAGKSPAIQSAS